MEQKQYRLIFLSSPVYLRLLFQKNPLQIPTTASVYNIPEIEVHFLDTHFSTFHMEFCSEVLLMHIPDETAEYADASFYLFLLFPQQV